MHKQTLKRTNKSTKNQSIKQVFNQKFRVMKNYITLCNEHFDALMKAVRKNKPSEDGRFEMNIVVGRYDIQIEGDMVIEYDNYQADNWYENGYNNYCEEVSREVVCFDIEVCAENEYGEVVYMYLDADQEKAIEKELLVA